MMTKEKIVGSDQGSSLLRPVGAMSGGSGTNLVKQSQVVLSSEVNSRGGLGKLNMSPNLMQMIQNQIPSMNSQSSTSVVSSKTTTSSTEGSVDNLKILDSIPNSILLKLMDENPNLSKLEIANVLAKDPSAISSINFYTAPSSATSSSSQSSYSQNSSSQSNVKQAGTNINPGSSSSLVTVTTTTVSTKSPSNPQEFGSLLTPQLSLVAPENAKTAFSSTSVGIQGASAPQTSGGSSSSSSGSVTRTEISSGSKTVEVKSGGAAANRAYFYPDIAGLG